VHHAGNKVSCYFLSFSLLLKQISVYQYYHLRLQDELFINAWSRNNQLIKLDPLQPNSVILAASHIARGNTTLSDIKRNIKKYFTSFQ